MRVFVFFAAFVACTFSSVQIATATDSGFTVTPPKLEIELGPGQSATGILRVVTHGTGDNYKLELGSATQNPDGSYAYNKPTGKSSDLSTWMKLSPVAFASGPGTNEPISWTISVPANADAGDHIAAIYVTQVVQPKAGSMAIQTRVAVGVRLRVAGDVVFAPQVSALTVPTISSNGPIRIKFSIANKGNLRLDFVQAEKAELQILKGSKVIKRFKITVLDDAKNRTSDEVFPGASRNFDVSWKKTPTFGQFKARVVLKFKKRPALTRSENFRILPYRVIIPVALVGGGGIVVGLVLVLRFIRSRRSTAK